jgi:hypothetical protein
MLAQVLERQQTSNVQNQLYINYQTDFVSVGLSEMLKCGMLVVVNLHMRFGSFFL